MEAIHLGCGLFCDIMTVWIPSEADRVPVADASCAALASGPFSEVEASPETWADEYGDGDA